MTLASGPWIDRVRNNPQVLTRLGDIAKIAAIPGGKPAGAWARSIGLAPQQLWREAATRAPVKPGKDGREIAALPPFTRKRLLDLYPCQPHYEDLLRRDNPGRARRYWDDALLILQREGIVEVSLTVRGSQRPRKGWQDEWLEEKLDLRPAGAAQEDVLTLAQRRRERAA